MYHANRYPYGAIGPVEFLWQHRSGVQETTDTSRPTSIGEEKQSTLDEKFSNSTTDHSAVQLVPSLSRHTTHEISLDHTSSKPVIAVEITGTKLWLVVSPAIYREVMMELSNAVERFCGRPVSVTSLKDEFVRFQLIGPRSHALVVETLKPVTKLVCDKASASSKKSISCPDLTKIPNPIPWWNGDTALSNHTQLLNRCLDDIKSASSPADFPEGAVLAMVVEDPRLHIPSKKIDMVSVNYPTKIRTLCGVGGVEWEDGEMEEGDEGVCEETSGVEDAADKYPNSWNLSDVELTSEDVASESKLETLGSDMESNAVMDVEACSADKAKLLPPELAYSPIWDSVVRETVKESRISDHVLNEVRSKLLVKSPVLELGSKSPRIPVLLIRKAYSARVDGGVLQLETDGCHGYHTMSQMQHVNTVYGSGWDLVLPTNWAMAFWVSLVYRGARACGLTELQKCLLECGVPSFPLDFPDTRAGRELAEEKRKLSEEKYLRYPPDKRRNYGKLLIEDPFLSPWDKLVKQWKSRSRIDRLLYDQVLSSTKVPEGSKSYGGPGDMSESGFDSGEETEMDISYVKPPPKRPRFDDTDTNVTAHKSKDSNRSNQCKDHRKGMEEDVSTADVIVCESQESPQCKKDLEKTKVSIAELTTHESQSRNTNQCKDHGKEIEKTYRCTSRGEVTSHESQESTQFMEHWKEVEKTTADVTAHESQTRNNDQCKDHGREMKKTGEITTHKPQEDTQFMKYWKEMEKTTADVTTHKSEESVNNTKIPSSLEKTDYELDKSTGDDVTQESAQFKEHWKEIEKTPADVTTHESEDSVNHTKIPSSSEKTDYELDNRKEVNSAAIQCVGEDDYHVLRSRSVLLQISHFFSLLCSRHCHPHTTSSETEHHEVGEQAPPSFHALIRQHGIDTLLKNHQNSLVAVSFEMLLRGNTSPCAIISAPSSTDLHDLVTRRNFHGPEETLCPKGLTVVDSNTICIGISGLTRKKLKEVNVSRKKKARERRTLEKRFGIPQGTTDEGLSTFIYDTGKIVHEYGLPLSQRSLSLHRAHTVHTLQKFAEVRSDTCKLLLRVRGDTLWYHNRLLEHAYSVRTVQR